jgi:hypothetical protein
MEVQVVSRTLGVAGAGAEVAEVALVLPVRGDVPDVADRNSDEQIDDPVWERRTGHEPPLNRGIRILEISSAYKADGLRSARVQERIAEQFGQTQPWP